MSTILYVIASPRGERSKSIKVAGAFLDAYRGRNPEDKIDKVDLFEMDLPPFDGLALQAKYTILHGGEPSDEEAEAWGRVEAVIEQFKAADKYLIATPMWNFHIPYRLKQYIDVIVQPTYTFNYDPEQGYTGLVTDKPVMIAAARGGDYEPEEMSGYDMQKPYLEAILRFIGLTDIRWAIAQPTLMQGPEVAEEKIQKAMKEAREIACSF